MDEQRSEGISDSANISTSAINPPQAQVREAAAFSKVRYGFTVTRLVLGVLLLTTAGLKLFDPSPETLSALELLSSPRWQMAAIEVEALLGLWLLSGVLPQLLWLAALSCFTVLASVSMYLGIDGQPSCGCFGAKLTVSPWYVVSLDLAAVASLIWWRPRRSGQPDVPYSATLRRVLTVAAGAGVILAVGFSGLAWMYGSPYESLLHVRGDFITAEPVVIEAGEGKVGEVKKISVQLTNHKDRPIRIIGGTTSCWCITTDDLPVLVLPNENRQITIRIRFRGRPGRFQHTFVFYAEDEEQTTVTVRVDGRVIASSEP